MQCSEGFLVVQLREHFRCRLDARIIPLIHILFATERLRHYSVDERCVVLHRSLVERVRSSECTNQVVTKDSLKEVAGLTMVEHKVVVRIEETRSDVVFQILTTSMEIVRFDCVHSFS